HAALFSSVCRVFSVVRGERPFRDLRLRSVSAPRLGASQSAERFFRSRALVDPAARESAANGAHPRSSLPAECRPTPGTPAATVCAFRERSRLGPADTVSAPRCKRRPARLHRAPIGAYGKALWVTLASCA